MTLDPLDTRPTNLPGIFVVGTDTDVGKTWVAAQLAKAWTRSGRRVGVLKPVATGAIDRGGRLVSGDAEALLAAIDGGAFDPPVSLDRVAPIVYREPVAPPVAARLAGVPLTPGHVRAEVVGALAWWSAEARAEAMVVEGVGGPMCPMAEEGWTLLDLAEWLDYPVIIVADRDLGAIGRTLVAVEVARHRGLRVAGVILNAARPAAPDADPLPRRTNAEELARRLGDVPILAEWGIDEAPPDPAEVEGWFGLARPPRASVEGPSGAIPAWAAGDSNPPMFNSDSSTEVPTRDRLGLVGDDPRWPESVPVDAIEPSSLGLPGPTIPPPRPRPTGEEAEDEGEEDGRSAAWPSVLLMSYASAVTLALLWTLWSGKTFSARSAAVPPADEGPSDPGRLASRSRTIEPPKPVDADHRVSVGGRLLLGSLQVEPVAIRRQDLELSRVNLTGKPERRPGDRGTAVLVLKLKNVSDDQVFSPVDPGYVRRVAGDSAETFAEVVGDQKPFERVYPGSLAVDSEWSVIGQSFDELRPGESREVVIATEADRADRFERSPSVWRIRLRISTDRTEAIEVEAPKIAVDAP